MAFGMLASSAPPIAIEFGVAALKALQIEHGDAPSLVAAACLETPDELRGDPARRFEFQAQALPQLLKNAGFKGKRAICSIPAGHMLVQHMQIQKVEGASLATQVLSQLQAQMNCIPSQVVCRPIEVPEGARGGKAEVICIAASRDLVLRQVQALRACKLEPVGAHSEHTALVRAFEHLASAEGDDRKVTLFLDIGAGSTKVAIAHGGDIVFAKTIHVGGRSLDQVVASQLRMSPQEARVHRLAMTEVAKSKAPAPAPEVAEAASEGEEASAGGMAILNAAIRKAGGDDAPAPPPRNPAPATATAVAGDSGVFPSPVASTPERKADLSEPLESLTDEVAMCLRYHGALFPGRKVERAIFVGGEARHVPLCQHIAKTLRLPARIADPLANISRTGKERCRGVDFSTAQPGWAVAFGLTRSPADL